MEDKVRISELAKAFSLAHSSANKTEFLLRERKQFREIARLIWQSCGAKEIHTEEMQQHYKEA